MSIPDQITNHVHNHEGNPDPNCVYCNGLVKEIKAEDVFELINTITDDYKKKHIEGGEG
jgi:hypothetical protein